VRKRISTQKKKQERQDMRPEITMQPSEKSIRYENVPSAMAEEGIIRLLILDPSLINKAEITVEDFTSPYLGKIFGIIKQRFESGSDTSVSSLSASLTPEEASHLTLMVQRPVSMANADRALDDYIEKIKTEKLKGTANQDLLTVRDRLREKKGFGG
jgi:DNA primase